MPKDKDLKNLFNEIIKIISKIKEPIESDKIDLLFEKCTRCFAKLGGDAKHTEGTINLLVQKSWLYLKDKNKLGKSLAVILNYMVVNGLLDKPASQAPFLLLQAVARINEINHSEYYNSIPKVEKIKKTEERTLQRDQEFKYLLERGWRWSLPSTDISNFVDVNNPTKEWKSQKELQKAIESCTVYSLLKTCEKVHSRLDKSYSAPVNDMMHIEELMSCLTDKEKSKAERLEAFYQKKNSFSGDEKPSLNLQRFLTEIEDTLVQLTWGAAPRFEKKDFWDDIKLVGFFRAFEKIPETINCTSDDANRLDTKF